MLDKLKKEDFEKHLNSKFELSHLETEEKIDIELIEAEDKSTEHTDCFSLIFKGPKDKVMDQNTHKLKHGKMEEMELFIGPIMSDKDDGVYYQAIFNRLKK
jgi:Domain of unknown function (DUF6916)